MVYHSWTRSLWPRPTLLSVTVVLCSLLGQSVALAEDLVHVKAPIFGCQNADVVNVINDRNDPRHFWAGWIDYMMSEGQCTRITTVSPWEPVSSDGNGLTLLAYRGTVARPASFYVPTSSIDFSQRAAPSQNNPPAQPPVMGYGPATQAEIQAAYCFGVATVVYAKILAWPPETQALMNHVVEGTDKGYDVFVQGAKKKKDYFAKLMGVGPGRQSPIDAGMADTSYCGLTKVAPDEPRCGTVGWCTVQDPD